MEIQHVDAATNPLGVKSVRQRLVLILARNAEAKGITVAEVRDPALHHGKISSVLSTLHRQGKLARLAEKRHGCRVYCLPEHVGDREVEPYGVRHRGDRDVIAAAATIKSWSQWFVDGDILPLDTPIDQTVIDSLGLLIDYANGDR